MTIMLIGNDTKNGPRDTSWSQHNRTYECRVLLCAEEGGGYSAIATRLPGVASQGDTKENAIENITDAFQAAIQTYLDDGGKIPWENNLFERPANCEERWILVNV